MAGEIHRSVLPEPTEREIDRVNWTRAELADHLFKTHGLIASGSATRRFRR